MIGCVRSQRYNAKPISEGRKETPMEIPSKHVQEDCCLVQL